MIEDLGAASVTLQIDYNSSLFKHQRVMRGRTCNLIPTCYFFGIFTRIRVKLAINYKISSVKPINISHTVITYAGGQEQKSKEIILKEIRHYLK